MAFAYSSPSGSIIWTDTDIIVKWVIGNTLQWNLIKNIEIFILKNALENVACKISLKSTASKMIFCDKSYNPSAG